MSDQTPAHQQLMNRVRQQTAFGQQPVQPVSSHQSSNQPLSDSSPSNQPSSDQPLSDRSLSDLSSSNQSLIDQPRSDRSPSDSTLSDPFLSNQPDHSIQTKVDLPDSHSRRTNDLTNLQKIAAMEAVFDQLPGEHAVDNQTADDQLGDDLLDDNPGVESPTDLATFSTSDPDLTPSPDPNSSFDPAAVSSLDFTPNADPIANPNPIFQPPTPVGNKQKEQLEGFGLAAQELPGGMQQVESEPSPEISPELESFLHQAEKPEQLQVEQQLKELAQQAAEEPPSSPQAMKVLPITKEQAQIGQKKSPKFSIRWLVEFSEKISKIFVGRAVYRQEKN